MAADIELRFSKDPTKYRVKFNLNGQHFSNVRINYDKFNGSAVADRSDLLADIGRAIAGRHGRTQTLSSLQSLQQRCR